MKKIMFSDKYCLTEAVLDGTKTMTRRVLKEGIPIGNWEEMAKYLPYKVGEVVAIAQTYNDIYNELEEEGDDVANDWWIPSFEGKVLDTLAGYKNKMFVRSDLMKHHIKITDVNVERLHDISDEDIMREGIRKEGYAGGCMYCYNKTYIHKGNRYVEPIYNTTPMRAFASLMYKVCGGEVWRFNPLVGAYSFELVD